MKDTQKKEQFIELRAKNWSYDRISKKLKVSKPVLIKWGKEFQIEINNLKAIELEALQEQYYINKAGRIESLGKQWQAILAEIKKRDLTDLSTERLFELLLKYSTALGQEIGPLTFKEETLWDSPDHDKVVRSWEI